MYVSISKHQESVWTKMISVPVFTMTTYCISSRGQQRHIHKVRQTYSSKLSIAEILGVIFDQNLSLDTIFLIDSLCV